MKIADTDHARGHGVVSSNHRAVMLFRIEGGYMLKFTARVKPTDFRDGELRPRVLVERRKKQLYTMIPLSEDTAHALKELFNNEPSL